MMLSKSMSKNVVLQLAPGLLAAVLVLPASAGAATYAEYGSKSVPMNSYGECWQAVDGITGCGIKDSDGDGVADDMDECPDTPKGVSVDAKGCPLDSDGDGVYDYQDKCPGTPAGVSVDSDGCPLDSDGDGVTDDMDKCPGTPQGARVDRDGCMENIVLDNILFELNSATLTGHDKAILDGLVKAFNRPFIKSILITGHTDSTGSDDYNMSLSKRRAASVAAYLKSAGVDVPMATDGKGESDPVADNGTREGRAQNRRVVVDVTMK